MNYNYELKRLEPVIKNAFMHLLVLILGILKVFIVRREYPVSEFNSGSSGCNLWFGSSMIYLNNLSHAAWRLSSSFPRLDSEIASL